MCHCLTLACKVWTESKSVLLSGLIRATCLGGSLYAQVKLDPTTTARVLAIVALTALMILSHKLCSRSTMEQLVEGVRIPSQQHKPRRTGQVVGRCRSRAIRTESIL